MLLSNVSNLSLYSKINNENNYTEQVSVAVTLSTYIRKVLFSNLGPVSGYPDSGFSYNSLVSSAEF